MKASKVQIDKFLEPKRLAIAGVSRNKKKFGFLIFKELHEKGYEVLPVNPNADSINGVECYGTIEELPNDISSILIITARKQTDAVLRNAIKKGIPNIWVQQASETENTLKIAEEYNQEIIYKKCIYMFAEPVAGFHKFHRTIMKLFGALPN